MLHFMSQNKGLLNLHEKKSSKLENFHASTTVFQTNINAIMRNLETQVGQLAPPCKATPEMHFIVVLR